MLHHAMILAAGTGTRLRPLTDHKPKALVEINGTPLLEVIIKRLIQQGISSFTVNIHHFAEQILQFLESKDNFGVSISVSDESAQLLDSGGGIAKASSLYPPNEDILIHNVDIICNIDIHILYLYHTNKNSIATLVVRNRDTRRYYLFNEEGQLCGWKNTATAEEIRVNIADHVLMPLAFSGISILSPEFVRSMQTGAAYPLRDELLRQAKKHNIFSYIHNEDYWMDVGKPEQLLSAEKFLQNSSFAQG